MQPSEYTNPVSKQPIAPLFMTILTPWGFFKFRWITVKWIDTVLLILFGSFVLGSWLEEMTEISAKEYALALLNPHYLYAEKMNMIWGSIQLGISILLVIISVLKPWKRQKTVS